jgi:hypothetical protein
MRLCVLPALAVMLTGCPIGLDYPAGLHSAHLTDSRLAGTWTAESSDAAVMRLTIAESSPGLYRITVLERGEMYAPETSEFNAWLTSVDGHTILVAEAKENESTTYYHHHIQFDGDDAVAIEDISLLVGGIDAVVSTEALRGEISSSLATGEALTERIWYYRD